MIERTKSVMRAAGVILEGIYYLTVFFFILAPVVWITNKLRSSGE